jgi:SPW repeat-containing protein
MNDHLPRARARDLLPALAATVIAASTAAPWALRFSASHAAVAGHIAFAMTVAPIALLISALPVAAVTTAAGGAWLAASPWALGYASLGAAAWSTDLLAGLTLVALGARARHIGHYAAPPGSRPGSRA